MDDSEKSNTEMSVEVVLSVASVESSEDPPMDEWFSLDMKLPEANKKKILYEDGVYDPGTGEICAEFITMSNSSVFRRAYYNYPAVTDPGIQKALFKPIPEIIYSNDGQALYLDICKEMKQCPVRIFYKGLVESRIINLRYYCINPDGVRAMAKALEYNKTVEVLDLSDNFLHDDACYHLGEMLSLNNTLTELNFHGCRIGPTGAKRLFCSLPKNRALQVLDLSHNNLGDDSMEYLAKAIVFGITVKNLNLSYNNITGKGVELLVEPFETHNKFTHLDLSWNTIFSPGGAAFLVKLSESTCLQVLNLSWNSLASARISLAIKDILLCPLLTELNLSNNLLKEKAIQNIIAHLPNAKHLTTLNLSNNPMTPSDAINVLNKVAMKASKVTHLLMDNVIVNDNFLLFLEQTKQMKSKENLVVTYGDVVYDFKAIGPDVRETVLNRFEYVTKKLKAKTDIATIALQFKKDKIEIISTKELDTVLRHAGASLDEDLIEELANCFPGPINTKLKNIDINVLVDYVKRKWPDRKLPLTPPPAPEPEPEQEPIKRAKQGKGKRKAKGKK